MSNRDSTEAGLALFRDHATADLTCLDDGPLRGLRHRTVLDHSAGAAALALWQEEHLPGFSVPLHLHDCEEIITVIGGEIEATVREKDCRLGVEQSILIPAWWPHGFRVIGSTPVKLLALFSSSAPGIFRLDGTRSTPPWEGGATDHLSAPAAV